MEKALLRLICFAADQGFSDPYFSSLTVEKLISNISTSASPATNSNGVKLSLLERVSSSSSHLVDILISQVWPSSITRFAAAAPSVAPNHAVGYIDDVVRRAKPRYHFATGAGNPPQFWEREPFVWDDEDGRVSRFVSLGAFGGDHGSAKKPRVRT